MTNVDLKQAATEYLAARRAEIDAETAERLSRAAADVAKAELDTAAKDAAFFNPFFDGKAIEICFDARDDRRTLILRRWRLLLADPRRLGNTVHVELSNFGLDEISNSDLDVLGNVGSVMLSNLPSITDISALRNVKKVILKNMPHLVAATKPSLALEALEREVNNATADAAAQDAADEKWLESIFDGRISSVCCSSTMGSGRRLEMLVADMRRVDKRHMVHIKNLEQITNKDLAVFANARKVSLCNAPLITDVSALCSVDEVVLFNLSEITDVSPLRSVRIVSLCSLPKISDVSALRGVDTLGVNDLPLVADVSALRGVRHLTLSMLPLVSDVSALRGVYDLVIHSMSRVSDVSALCKVPKLYVHSCNCGNVER